jgi:hypothetical protein
MFLLFKILLASITIYAYDITTIIIVDPKYQSAVKAASTSAYKQSGLETDSNKLQSASQDKANTWIKANGLTPVVATVAVIAPVLINKRIQINTGNFAFIGTETTKQITWHFKFF